MQERNKKETLKVHLQFVGIFLLVVLVTVGLKIWGGADVKSSIWQTVTGIRPMELALLIGFWYQAIQNKRPSERKSGLTTLQLNGD